MTTARQVERFIQGVFELLVDCEDEELVDVAANTLVDGPTDDTVLKALQMARDMEYVTYEEGGYMTLDAGVVVKVDGVKFHITIMKGQD